MDRTMRSFPVPTNPDSMNAKPRDSRIFVSGIISRQVMRTSDRLMERVKYLVIASVSSEDSRSAGTIPFSLNQR